MREVSRNIGHKKRINRKKQLRRRIFAVISLLILLFLLFTKSSDLVSAITAHRLRANDYPKSLVALMERNPEARQFVLDYPKNKDRTEEIDISSEVSIGEFPLFLQWDERWGYETYGNDFLAVTGCGPTCLSMVTCGLTGNSEWNPYKTASFADQSGYYVPGAGSSWDLMENGAAFLGLQVHSISPDAAEITGALQSGMPVICSMRPGDFTTSGHFIVLIGVDDNGKIIVHDPNSRKNSKKSWGIDTLVPQIKGLWAYSLASTIQ